jgi:hypothetical protein
MNNEQLTADNSAGKALFPVGFGLSYSYLSRK